MHRAGLSIGPSVLRLLAVAGATMLSVKPLSLAFGLDFLVGIILPFVFVRANRPAWAMISAIATAAPTLWLWGHSYFAVILLSEVAIIIALARHRVSMLYATLLYWISVGAILVFLFYYAILDTSLVATIAVYAKQAINSVYMVLLVDFTYFIYVSIFLSINKKEKIFISEYVQTAALLTFLTFSMIAIIVSSHDRQSNVLSDATAALDKAGALLHTDLQFHIRQSLGQAGRSCGSTAGTSEQDRSGCLLAAFRESAADTLAGFGAGSPDDRERSTIVDAIEDHVRRGRLDQLRDEALSILPISTADTIYLVPFSKGVPRIDDAVMGASATQVLRILEQSQGIGIQIAPRRPAGIHIQVGKDDRQLIPLTEQTTLRAALTSVKPLVRAWTQSSLVSTNNIESSNFSIVLEMPLAQQIDGYFRAVTKMLLAAFMAILLGALIMHIWMLIIRNEFRHLISFTRLPNEQQAESLLPNKILRRSPLAEVRDLVAGFQSILEELDRKNGAIDDIRRRYERIISGAPGVLFTLVVERGHDDQARIGRCSYISASIQDHLGYGADEARGSNWWESSVHLDDWARVEQEMAELLETGRKSIEYRLRTPGGGFRWVYSELSVVSDPDGRAIEIIGFLSDHEDAHSTKERLYETERLASLGQMASGMAHELAQPLNTIGMTAQNIKLHLEKQPFDRQYFINKNNRVLDQVSRAGKIIRNLRIFGKSANIPAHPISASRVASAIVQQLREPFDKQGIKIMLHGFSDEFPLTGEETMVEQILLNLVNNARDAYLQRPLEGQPKGVIDVRLRYSRSQRKGWIVVEDSAGGIDADIMPRIFNPFVSSKPPGKGMGLGLALSKVMAKDMGGDLKAENTTLGARFTLSLNAAAIMANTSDK